MIFRNFTGHRHEHDELEKVIEEISKDINAKKGVALKLNKLSTATMIKDELEINKRTVATPHEHLKSSSDRRYISCMQRIELSGDSFLYIRHKSTRCEKQSVFIEDVELAVKRLLQDYRPKIDSF